MSDEPRRMRPILDGELARSALSCALAIARELRVRPCSDPTLAGGAAGQAILFAYLAVATGEPDFLDAAAARREQALDALEEVALAPGLYSGVAGIGWAIEHLRCIVPALSAGDSSDLLDEVDDALATAVQRWPAEAPYDLVSGLAGIGLYALERGPSGHALAGAVIERLVERARPTGAGRAFWTDPSLIDSAVREHFPGGYVDCGVAHGVPGAIAFLAGSLAANIDRARVEGLLADAVSWLLGVQRADDASRFPYTSEGASDLAPARTAWCYGDAGVAAVLALAARAMDLPTWERAAREIANAASRRALPATGVVDAALCHGASGLALIFARLGESWRDRELIAVARGWSEDILGRRREADGIRGIRCALAARTPVRARRSSRAAARTDVARRRTAADGGCRDRARAARGLDRHRAGLGSTTRNLAPRRLSRAWRAGVPARDEPR